MSSGSGALSFSPEYRVKIVPDEGAYLLSERTARLLAGPESGKIASLIDGTRDADEIVRKMDGVLSAAVVYYRLGQMIDKGYLEVSQASIATNPPERAFWHGMGLTGEVPLHAQASLVKFGDVSLDIFSDALRSFKIETGEGFAIAVTDEYTRPELRAFNDEMLAGRREWLLAKPTGTVVWVGPIFAPGRTGCWQCLASRLQRNRAVETYLSRRAEPSMAIPTVASHPAAALIIAQIVAIEVARWLAAEGLNQTLEGSLLTLDLSTMSSTRHTLVRRPQCPSCGDDGGGGAPTPKPSLTSRPKSDILDGLQRTTTAEETLRRYRHQISPLIGAVTQLTKVPLGSDFLNVFTAGHNFALRSPDLTALRLGLRTSSAGKGVTAQQAEASALCEGLERYSGIFDGSESRISASYEELGADAIHPNACMLFSELQFAERERWNTRESTFQKVPYPFQTTERHEWSPVWSMTRQRLQYLPTGYLYYDYPVHKSRSQYWADSNGCAAGNCAEEAILSGILELIERDAVAIWWYNRMRQPLVDLEAFDDPWLAAVKRKCRDLHREVWALDLTVDTGVPVFGAFSRRRDKPVEDILLAFGAHLDPRIALRRAFAEMTQFLPAVMHVDRDGNGYAFDDPESLAWWRGATLENQSYLLPASDIAARTPSSYRTLHSGNVLEDITLCQRKLEGHDLEVIVIDQTRRDIQLPVWKVIVPGMRHFWARFAVGRLYDLPVWLDRLAKPTAEADLNPIAMFI